LGVRDFHAIFSGDQHFLRKRNAMFLYLRIRNRMLVDGERADFAVEKIEKQSVDCFTHLKGDGLLALKCLWICFQV